MSDEPEELPLEEIRRRMREWERELEELPTDPKELRKLAYKKIREMRVRGGCMEPGFHFCPPCGKRLP